MNSDNQHCFLYFIQLLNEKKLFLIILDLSKISQIIKFEFFKLFNLEKIKIT